MKDEKYIVFKRQDLDRALEEMHYYPGQLDDISIQDAVVIRRQDAFAPPALDAYASAITTAVEVMDQYHMPVRSDRDRLMAIADYFHAQAEEAWHTDRKIPD